MEFIHIGKIVNTHGIKGELRIKSNFEYKDKIFVPGFYLYIGKGYAKEEIVTYRHHKEFEMVTFKGYNNINQVLNYLKMDVYVAKEDLKLNNNEYILEELIGYSIFENGKFYGKVVEIVYNNINILLKVDGDKEFYIPNNPHFIKRVNQDTKEITTENIEGLML